MKILLTILITILGLSTSYFASAATCERKIILLPQLVIKRSQLNSGPVALSQYMIVRHLDNFPGLAVFSDNIEQDLTGDDYHASADSNPETQQYLKYKATFPDGVPGDFDRLNEAQKAELIQDGGDMIALLSGRISTLYTAVNGPELATAFAHEKEALSEINAYFTLTPGARSVILILGAGFDLTRHTDQFDPECIVTPPDLKALTTPAPATL